MKRLLFLGVCVLVAFMPVQAQAKLGKAEKAAIAATPEQIANLVEVKSDSLDAVTRLSTESFYKQKGLFGSISADKFLRAIVDKKTKTVVIQVYVWFTYSGDWYFADRMNYKGPKELETVKAIRIAQDVGSCSRYGCSKSEQVAFTIPRSHLEAAAEGAAAGQDASWQFKIFGKYEDGQVTGILKTEIAGMLIAVDRELQRLGQ